MKNKLALLLLSVLMIAASSAAQLRGAKSTLDIYVIDVEGGNAVLFVTPAGESVLIDTGNPGTRDAGRIVAAAKDAGITQIDHLIITHWHIDHFGGLTQLLSLIPVKQIIDHGPSIQADPKVDPAIYAKAKHLVVKAGDKIPVAGLDWRIVAAAGHVLQSPLPGAGAANPDCADSKPREADPSENAQSVSSLIVFGKFRVVHMGDLTWNKEIDLMCPNNRLGTTDLLIVSHHGLPISNSPALVHALRPRVAIVNNGTRKGAHPEAMKTVFSSPGLEGVWQIHFSLLSGQEYTVPGLFIANGIDSQPASMPVGPMENPPSGPSAPPPPQHEGTAYWIKVSARPDGSFTVSNARNGFSKTYGASGHTRPD
jgi:competence protein ComEC